MGIDPARIYLTADGKTAKVESKIPEGYYLPQATGTLVLYRLVKLDAPKAYAMLSYAQKNLFNTRTLSIEGKSKIEQGGKTIDAIRATDQTSVAAEPSVVYLDEKGDLLRLESPEGLVMENTTRDEVAKAFPEAKP